MTDASEEAWRLTLTRFDERHRRLIEAVATLTDERLREIVPGKDYTVEYMLRASRATTSITPGRSRS